MVELLLSLPDVEYGSADREQRSPFWIACSNGMGPVVDLLLNRHYPIQDYQKPDRY